MVVGVENCFVQVRELEVRARSEVREVSFETRHVCADCDAKFGDERAGEEVCEGGGWREEGESCGFGVQSEVEYCNAISWEWRVLVVDCVIVSRAKDL